MNSFKFSLIVLLSSIISFYSCNDNTDSGTQEAKESLEVSESPTLPNTDITNPTTPEPAQNAAGVWHYTCSKGCAGGSGMAGNCATCGGPLAHNPAYHSNANSPQTTTQGGPIATPPPTAEPAQNAAGVWHFTCAKGCSGGAGTAGTCGTCGGALTHNTAYHQ